jgi:hypothetical protein
MEGPGSCGGAKLWADPTVDPCPNIRRVAAIDEKAKRTQQRIIVFASGTSF